MLRKAGFPLTRFSMGAVTAHYSLTRPCGPKPRQWKPSLRNPDGLDGSATRQTGLLPSLRQKLDSRVALFTLHILMWFLVRTRLLTSCHLDLTREHSVSISLGGCD